jgi:hypothetical protein
MASPSPKKSLSVRLDNESKPSIHAKVLENSYKSVENFFFLSNILSFPGQPQSLQWLHIGRQKKRRSKDVSNKSYIFFNARHEYTNSVNNIQVIFSVERREIG